MKAAKNTTNHQRIYNASLSKRQVALLAGWERERRVSVTTEDIRRAVGADAAREVARRLVNKKVLERVARGTFLVRPLRSLSRPTTASTAAQAAALLQGKPYYLGGLWAVTFHRLTEQQHVSALDAFITGWKRSQRLSSARITFHRVDPARLSYGVANAMIEGLQVQLSDPERTLLDLFDTPSLAGNARTALTLVTQALPRADGAKLVEYAVRGSRHSTCQRLGVLLERLGTAPRKLARLHAKTRETRSMLSMLPGASRTGPFNRRWRVVENDQ